MRNTKPSPAGSTNAFLQDEIAASKAAPVSVQGGQLTYEPGRRYEQMTTVLVPIELVVQNKFQPRLWMNPAKVRELASSIKQTGQLQAASGKQLEDGRVMLIAGGTRAEAVKLLYKEATEDERARFAHLRVELKIGVPDSELLRQALHENMVREDLNPMDEAASLAQYRELNELKKASDVAADIGMDERKVRTLLQLHDDCPAVVHAAVRGQDLAPFMRTEAELAAAAEGGAFLLPPAEPRKADRTISRDAAIEFGKLHKHFRKTEPMRATLLTARHIQRALEDGWNLMRVKEFVKRATSESKEGIARAKPAVFRVEGSVFNVNLRMLADASEETIVELREKLEHLIQNRKTLLQADDANAARDAAGDASQGSDTK
ncbi:ParB/RepB/Spo0J family partition protein [Pyxidicoccus sp. MSG2]|uniref:ParB/RepB/Spo0J family partition protein n=1 Tax=Pyxidicoccus sp. MSG2 TaxID=2996790 RepID=UPI00226F1CF9|nr:ParB N-terminal domain-containing protein [Pyxidicoccus sp. MSG2]MCY1023935.1 ParB N-terminal domain-containing protein [Pyxidicoccus sp. MSG2]